MEKDLFELMSKMYSEMQTGFKELKSEVNELRAEVVKTNFVIENDIKPSIEALYDGYKQNSESINRIEDDIKEIRLAINELQIKTIKNENSIISFSRKLVNLNNVKH